MVSTRIAVSLLYSGILVGCSAIAPSSRPASCVVPDGGVDPCLARRMRCVEGECRPVCLEGETCNRLDDDCDQKIDEGIDQDGDGSLGCAPEAPDCDDQNSAVHPGAPKELCNGIDDDCDGYVDMIGDATICAEGLACIPRRGGCVQPSCADPEGIRCSAGSVCDTMSGACEVGDDCTQSTAPCPAGEGCDPITHRCSRPAALGESCSTGYACASGVCFPGEALGFSIQSAPGVCGVACCSNSDCEGDQVCWAPGTGARSCVPRELLVSLGGTPSQMLCADDQPCGGEVCRISSVDGANRRGVRAFACGRDNSLSRPSCSSNSECSGGLCLAIFEQFLGPPYGPCVGPCRTDRECLSYSRAFADYEGLSVALHCEAYRFEGESDWISVCLPDFRGRSPAGESCDRDGDCLSSACIDSRCRSTCCSSSDCSGTDACTPVFVSGHWGMHCVPKEGS